MPIRTQSDLPAKEILEQENIFVMDESRAMHQDIRPINIVILNLMPLKEETELQIFRSLSNTPLQVDVSLLAPASHASTHTSKSHLNKFYQTFQEIKNQYFDGLRVTEVPFVKYRTIELFTCQGTYGRFLDFDGRKTSFYLVADEKGHFVALQAIL